MNKYVVDASVVIQHFIADNHTVSADVLFALVNNMVRVYVPEFCLGVSRKIAILTADAKNRVPTKTWVGTALLPSAEM